MKKVDFVKKLAERQDISYKEAENNFNTLVDLIADVLFDGEELQFNQIGKFKMKKKNATKERILENTIAGRVVVPAKPACVVPDFKMSKKFVDEVRK